MHPAKDSQVLALAADEERILVSEDADFGAPHTNSQAALPALVPLRSADPLTPMTTLVCPRRDLCESTPRWPPKRSRG
jgi:predicted nuclease of predicted toxin-antitoxin system